MDECLEFLSQEKNSSGTKAINKNISPIENPNLNSLSPSDQNEIKPPKIKKFPNFPIKNIYSPELFLEQEYIEKFICGICENVCDDPVMQLCGCEQMYCRKCLLFYYDNYHHKCPECKKETKEPTAITAVGVIIKLKKMKCKNYTLDCTWQGQCRDYKKHIANDCPKEIINCPNKGCIFKLRREDMDEHLEKCEYREIICSKCNLKIPINQSESHKEVCIKEKILCPQNCGEIIERGDINLHKKSCICSLMECPYTFLGCKHTFIKKDKEKFLNEFMSFHLDLAVKKIFELENLKEKIQIYENEIKELKLFREFKEKDLEEKNGNGKNENQIDSDKKNEIIHISENGIVDNLNNNENVKKELGSFNEDDNKTKLKDDLNQALIETGNSKYEEKNMSKTIDLENSKQNIINNYNFNSELEEKNSKFVIKHFLSKKRESSPTNITNIINSLNSNDINTSQNMNVISSIVNYVDSDEESGSSINDKTKENNFYEFPNSTKSLFIINNNIIETKSLKGEKRHHYVFFDSKFNIPTTSKEKHTIKFKILKDTVWLGMGICDKKIVERNNYEYIPSKQRSGKKTNNGSYIFNNQIIWNCNNFRQCQKFLNTIFKENTTIECNLVPVECELEFKYDNNLIIKFNDVRCFKSDFFSPCLIFLHNSKVETTFIYP